jgi:hypothetical protein
MQTSYNLIPQLAAKGVLNFVEGGNEEDNAYAISLGNSIAYTATFQQQVFQLGRSLGLPVINMSFGSGWTAANNWRGNYDKVGDLSAYTDYGNAHTYPNSASGQPNATVLMLNANAKLAAVSRPVITTELGWDNATVKNEVTVAKNVLNGVFDSARSGNPYTYIYALFDDQSGKFGMMNLDGSPKPAGTALHNLTTLLADASPSAGNVAGSLTYQVTGGTGKEGTYLLQKTDGTYWLSVWDEYEGTQTITVTLANQAQQVEVFDPLTGTNAIQTASNTNAVSFALTDHPVLIRVVPVSTAGRSQIAVATDPPNVVTSYASNSTVAGDSGTTGIYSYGTGNTITGGSGISTIQAFSGGNTINTGTGTATVRIAGAANKVTTGSGTTTVYDSGTATAYTLGAGTTDIYGPILQNGATLNLKAALAGTQWNGSMATLTNFVKVSTTSADATVSVTPSGAATGASIPVATLHGYSYLNIWILLPRLIVQ